MKSKNIFLFLLIGILPFKFIHSQGVLDYQEYYIGTGYNVGWGKFDAFNSILNKYNDANTQEKEFRELHAPNGFVFAIGTNQSFFNFEAGFTQRQQRSKTRFSVNETLFRREARLRINSYYLNAGVFFPSTQSFGIGANVSFDINNVRYSTREAEDKSVGRQSFVSPVIDQVYGMTFDLKFYFGVMDDHGTKLMIRPFYSFLFKSVDGTEFDTLLNNDSSGNLSDNLSHFGVKFIITYSVIK